MWWVCWACAGFEVGEQNKNMRREVKGMKGNPKK